MPSVGPVPLPVPLILCGECLRRSSLMSSEIVSDHFKPRRNGRNGPGGKIDVSGHFSSKRSALEGVKGGTVRAWAAQTILYGQP